MTKELTVYKKKKKKKYLEGLVLMLEHQLDELLASFDHIFTSRISAT